jgi:hypothetical protein
METIKTIRTSLEAAKAKQAETLTTTSPVLPPAEKWVAEPAVISTNAALPYTEVSVNKGLSEPSKPLPRIELPVFFPVRGANFVHQLGLLLQTVGGGGVSNIQEVHHFVDQIPILDPTFWRELRDSTLDPHQLVGQINQLSREYHKSLLRRSSKIRQEDYFVQIKLLKIADKLFKMQTMSGGWPMRRTLSFPLYFPLLRHVFNGEIYLEM